MRNDIQEGVLTGMNETRFQSFGFLLQAPKKIREIGLRMTEIGMDESSIRKVTITLELYLAKKIVKRGKKFFYKKSDLI